jgi:hypothetical protein
MTVPTVLDRVAAQTVAPPVQRCLVLTMAGAPVSAGVAALNEHADRLEVQVAALTAPGALLNLHLGQGACRFLLALADGRTLTVELVATTWQAPGGRVCRFRAAAQP